MPSLGKIRYRCDETVRWDMYSRVAISRLVKPVAASRAISRSCGVSDAAPPGVVARRAGRPEFGRRSPRPRTPHRAARSRRERRPARCERHASGAVAAAVRRARAARARARTASPRFPAARAPARTAPVRRSSGATIACRGGGDEREPRRQAAEVRSSHGLGVSPGLIVASGVHRGVDQVQRGPQRLWVVGTRASPAG